MEHKFVYNLVLQLPKGLHSKEVQVKNNLALKIRNILKY